MGPGAVGQDVAFEPKDSLKLKKKKDPEFPKCLHHTLPLSAPFSCDCIPWAKGSERTLADLGKGVAKEDGVGEGGYVTTSSHPSPPSIQLSSPPIFAMAIKIYSLCLTP